MRTAGLTAFAAAVALGASSPCQADGISLAPKAPGTAQPAGVPADFRLALDASRVLYADAASAVPAGGEEDLAKKLQNPVADLISVPLQFNFDEPIGPKQSARMTLNIQPVIPVSLSPDWNLITRTIFPLVYRESAADGQPYRFGTGDIVQSFFFSPRASVSGWIVGAGPVFLWPTASDDSLGSGQWAAGPTVVVLKQESGWTYGVLANHLWSYAGPHSRQDVNATFVQPFISYTFPTFTTLGLNTETTYDWTNHQWTVPINISVSQLIKIGGQPVSFSLGGRYYAEGPSGGPEWGVRFAVTFLFPK